MAPIVLDAAHGVRHALGATGGPRIPPLVLTAVVDVTCFGSTLDEAIAAPHLSVQPADGRLELEGELAAQAAAEGALTIAAGDFGPAYGITRAGGGYLPGVDRRFESGLALV
jgi:gamma-glutamyltranspeptidase